MKIGVIGTGYWGPNIIKNLLALNQELIVYDINKANAQNTLQRFQECKSVNSLEDILQNPNIKAVVIAVPLKLHYQLVIKSLQAGKHVYVEKPLCYSSDEADKIQIHLKGKVLMVGHITLYTPGIKKIKEFITNSSIGKLTNISLTRTHLGPIYPEIDVATEVASHDIAILLFMIHDMPVTVNAWGTSRLGLNNQDNANIIIGYKDSLKSTINVQWTSVIRERMIVVEGTTGTIVCKTNKGKEELTLYNQQTAFEALKNGAKPQEAMLMVKSEDVILKDAEPLYDELHSFLYCIENNLIPLTNFEFSRKVVSVSEAIRKSMKLNGKTEIIRW
jgi:predicted dehydrogenase